MEVGALEPEPPDGDLDPQQLQAAFELLRRAAYRPGRASGKGGKPGAPGTDPGAKAREARAAEARAGVLSSGSAGSARR
eukprot:6949378-Alexandrium_andersonii.AAC.1